MRCTLEIVYWIKQNFSILFSPLNKNKILMWLFGFLY
jgi:hypothetical protein